MAHGPVIVGNGGTGHSGAWSDGGTGGLINKSPYQTNQVQRDNRRGIPAELHDEIMATKAFKKRRVETVKSTSEAFKRAMFKEADQEADAVVSAAARLGVGQHQYADVRTADYVPEQWSQKLISRFYEQLRIMGRI